MPHSGIRPLFDLLHLNSYLMLEAIEQFDEQTSQERVLGHSKNSFKFVLGHIVWSRGGILGLLGKPLNYPWLEKFGGGQSHSDGSDYPQLSEVAAAYTRVATSVEKDLHALTEEAFMAPIADVPGEQENTLRGAISFWVWQDCYHTGQVGSILTTLGLTDLKTLHYERKQRRTTGGLR